ncbi:MAG: hypothetical protein JWN04_5909 [Myxococcaceae bacterium]|nr:hypothetical protein [Myxococcaceae bacterium]
MHRYAMYNTRRSLHQPRSFRSGMTWRCCVLGLMALSACGHMRTGSAARAIDQDLALAASFPAHVGAPQAPRAPLASPLSPQHPFMAPRGASNMHVDSFTSNTYAWRGPLGHAPEVASRSMGLVGGECPTINFDKRGRIVTLCVRQRSPSLLLLDAESLTVLARYDLPTRRTPLFRLRKMMNDTSGGAYFYLDHKGRAVLGTADGAIEIVALRDDAQGLRFEREERIELASALALADGSRDKVTAVLPDFQGNLWFVARYGTIGLITPERAIHTLRFAGEEVENSFSIGPEATYVVSDHALYRLEQDSAGKPRVIWRERYDRGQHRKVGQINQGSGTTPTLLGTDYVAIGDNAEPRMNVIVMRRDALAERRIVCKQAVFAAGKSATENTFIGYQRSLIVENNAGYDLFTTMRGGKTSAPGIARIDVRADESGCDVVWESEEISQTTVPKLSTETGLVYLYTKLPNAPHGADAYYFTALDFHTGRTVYQVLTGTGVRYDNNWAAISLAPDGTAFVGVLNGLIRVRDSVPVLPLPAAPKSPLAAPLLALTP